MTGKVRAASLDAAAGLSRRKASAVGRRFLILHNPAAGPHRAQRRLQEVIGQLRHRDCALDLCETTSLADNRRLAAAAAVDGDFDAVVAAGGDGTVRATASALTGTGMPLGIIPVGTGNVMAHEIGLRLDAAAIASCLVEGHVATVRAANANGEQFFLMVGAGFDGRVVAWLDTGLKRRLGKLAYVWPVIRAVLAGPDRLRARIDGAEREAAWAIVTLRQRYAGAFLLAPKATLEASNIHAVLFKAQGRLSMLGQLATIAAGRIAVGRGIEDVAGDTVEITADPPVPVQIDGEPFGTTPVRIRTGGPSLKLIVPSDHPAAT